MSEQDRQTMAQGAPESPELPDTVPTSASESTASAQAPVTSLEDQLAAALAKAQAWEEEYLRARADMENLRKRSAQEVLNASKFAIESFAEGLLAVADSLEMALAVENQTLDGLRGGVELTLKQLQQAFQKGKLAAIEPLGEKFDPNRHQAVTMVDGSVLTPPVPSNHVVQVMQKGYMVADRVLRPAIVIVAQ